MKKLKLGLLTAIIQSYKYQKMNQQEREQVQEQRLQKLVTYVKENSPYFHDLYQDIHDHFILADLPVTNKSEMMNHFDDWICDQSIKFDDLNEFMKDLDHIGRKYNGKYLVFTTSGSTGNPAVVLSDQTHNNCMGGVNILRSYARKQDMKAFIKAGGKSIGIYATEGFYLGNSTIRARLLSMPWKKKQMAVTSALLPIAHIVEELNQFQPAMLGGYPTVLEMLLDEQRSGRLHIQPIIIMTGGENLSETLREQLSETFYCYTQTSYSCTEGGSIACECSEHHFHINDDWVIVEAVDKDNKAVADGVLSDKILITNLTNYTQPFIRYEVSDRVVMHHEACTCGNKSPWISLDGRSDDVVSFVEDGREIKVPPLAIIARLKEVHEIMNFQVVVYSQNRIEIRVVPVHGDDINATYELAKKQLTSYLSTLHITHLEFIQTDLLPQRHPKSGKLKQVIRCDH